MGPGAWEFPEQPPIVERCNWTWLGYHLKPITTQQLVLRSADSVSGRGALTPKPRTTVPQACYLWQHALRIYRAHSALEPKRFVLGKT